MTLIRTSKQPATQRSQHGVRGQATLIGIVAVACLTMTYSSGALAQSQAASTVPAAACPTLLNHTVNKLQDNSPINLCQYAGKVVLVVNTASKCGFTGQFEPLENLHKKYKAQGLVVLGFPSNDFSQELSSNKAIADFCFNTYGVDFPMASKTMVRGKDSHPFYKQLATASKGDVPSWNFHKYLIARDGKTVTSYSPLTSPDNAKVVKQIETLLAQKN